MTPGQLAEIRARLEAATPGPWLAEPQTWETVGAHPWPTDAEWQADEQSATDALYSGPDICTMEGWPPESRRANAEFIAAAPSDIAALLAEVDRLRAVTADRDRRWPEGWVRHACPDVDGQMAVHSMWARCWKLEIGQLTAERDRARRLACALEAELAASADQTVEAE